MEATVVFYDSLSGFGIVKAQDASELSFTAPDTVKQAIEEGDTIIVRRIGESNQAEIVQV